MITGNEVYNELLSIKKKMEFLSDSKNTNDEKAIFWKMLCNRMDKNIIEYIERDKRIYNW